MSRGVRHRYRWTILDDNRNNFGGHDLTVCVEKGWGGERWGSFKVSLPTVQFDVARRVAAGGGHGRGKPFELEADIYEDEEVDASQCSHVNENKDYIRRFHREKVR